VVVRGSRRSSDRVAIGAHVTGARGRGTRLVHPSKVGRHETDTRPAGSHGAGKSRRHEGAGRQHQPPGAPRRLQASTRASSRAYRR